MCISGPGAGLAQPNPRLNSYEMGMAGSRPASVPVSDTMCSYSFGDWKPVMLVVSRSHSNTLLSGDPLLDKDDHRRARFSPALIRRRRLDLALAVSSVAIG